MTTETAAPQGAFSDSNQAPKTGLRPVNRLLTRNLENIGKLDIYLKIRSLLAEDLYLVAPFEMRELLDPEDIRTALEMRGTRSLPLLEGIRNVLVVLPLMVTWFSLGLAALAYHQSLSLPKKQVDTIAGQGIFQQWQAGFPLLQNVALGSWHIPLSIGNTRFTFSEVALLDVAILNSLLLLTALIYIIEGRAHQIGVKVAKLMEEELATFSQLSLELNPESKDGAPPWAAKLQNSVYTLARITDELPKHYMRIRESSEWIAKTLGKTEEMRKIQDDAAKTWQEMNETLRKAVDSILEIGVFLNPDLADRWHAMQTRPPRRGSKSRFTRLGDWMRQFRSDND